MKYIYLHWNRDDSRLLIIFFSFYAYNNNSRDSFLFTSFNLSGDSLHIFILTVKTFEKNFTWAVIIICIFRVAVECKRNRTPVPRSSIFLPSFKMCALSSCSSTRRFYFFVVRCRYRNPFSLLVRVIRGFKTAFHHQTLQRSWRERCHCERRRERRRRRLRRRRRQWWRREKNFSCWKDRPNASTRIVRRVLMDYPSTRKPVDQREFIVTAFPIDVYSYLDKRLDIDVMLSAWLIQ